MPSRLRFGLVGAGAIAQSYLEAFKRSERAELVAVADVRAEIADALGKAAGCRSYDSHRTMLAQCRLDAVLVCTPPLTHAQISIDILNRGVNVLCEKPLSISIESARAMLDVAKANGVTLTMASKFRHVEDVVRAKSLVQSGIVGDIVMIENAFTSRVDMSSRWNANPRLSGGGVLIDNGTHSVDLLRYFLGSLHDVQVFEGLRIQRLAVEDTVRIFARNTHGVIGTVDLSWSINKELDTYLRIYGSLGTVLVGWKESKFRVTSNPEWTVFGNGYDKIQAFRSQVDNFVRAIVDGEPLVVTPEDALASVEVVNAAYAALRSNKWTPVDRPARAAEFGSMRRLGFQRLP